LNSGTLATKTAELTPNHPGVLSLNSSTSVDSGVTFTTGASTLSLGGNERSVAVFKLVIALNTTIRFGLHDGNTSADAVDPTPSGIMVNQEATCSINASGVSYIYLAIS
jgi:hypothetical protein